MDSLFHIAILGGDLRSAYLSEILQKRGCCITVYGVCTTSKDIYTANSLEELIDANEIIVGPIPTTKDAIHIFSLEEKEDLKIDYLKKHITKDKFFFGGVIPNTLTQFFTAEKISFFDYMKDDDIALQNAIATAEGTIMEAIQHSSRNLHKSRCLILGYGRCAAILGQKLSGLDAHVTICARKQSARTAAYCFGYDTLAFEHLSLCISDYDYIFNTIPSLVLPKELLSLVSSDKTIIDIASAPGGLDYTYANEQSLNAHLCLGLPGRFSPESSAGILADKIINLLKERSE